MTTLTHRFTQAVDYARIAHASQVRKGSGVPYIYHLLAVASLVLAHGGHEDQVIAGLLHDVLEDCGAGHEPTIRALFGEVVADIVLACTDGTAEGKARHVEPEAKRHHWQLRKVAYLANVRQESDAALLVSACDKLHNASAIVEDLENPAVGRAAFQRFTATREQTLGYYQSLSDVFTARQSPVARVFDAMVARMHALAGAESRVALPESP
ncbi:MAG: guanosine polyphosphate pyrophosphohydrolase [Acidobacteria bacterium RIFCSPLOWO2_02_FULL_65_29]|nr:MAG: guanosine polyphosphate pyrophosphohydrolase [Acidobacteria bacterium RIFCSPLOWO2_02_FULL_65_29]